MFSVTAIVVVVTIVLCFLAACFATLVVCRRHKSYKQPKFDDNTEVKSYVYYCRGCKGVYSESEADGEIEADEG